MIKIVRHAICETEMGIAGYAEFKLPDGRQLEICGRWDDVYKSEPDEGKIAQCWETVIIDNNDVTDKESECGTHIDNSEFGYNSEELMWKLHNGDSLDDVLIKSEDEED